jgi:hypothetical protein
VGIGEARSSLYCQLVVYKGKGRLAGGRGGLEAAFLPAGTCRVLSASRR